MDKRLQTLSMHYENQILYGIKLRDALERISKVEGENFQEKLYKVLDIAKAALDTRGPPSPLHQPKTGKYYGHHPLPEYLHLPMHPKDDYQTELPRFQVIAELPFVGPETVPVPSELEDELGVPTEKSQISMGCKVVESEETMMALPEPVCYIPAIWIYRGVEIHDKRNPLVVRVIRRVQSGDSRETSKVEVRDVTTSENYELPCEAVESFWEPTGRHYSVVSAHLL